MVPAIIPQKAATISQRLNGRNWNIKAARPAETAENIAGKWVRDGMITAMKVRGIANPS